MKTISIDGLGGRVAVSKPSIVGAAFRVFLLGGSALNEKEARQAAGSGFIMKNNGEEVWALVSELEARVKSEAV